MVEEQQTDFFWNSSKERPGSHQLGNGHYLGIPLRYVLPVFERPFQKPDRAKQEVESSPGRKDDFYNTDLSLK